MPIATVPNSWKVPDSLHIFTMIWLVIGFYVLYFIWTYGISCSTCVCNAEHASSLFIWYAVMLCNMDRPEHHSIDCLKERGVEKRSGRHSTLQGREKSVFNQALFESNLGRLLRDGGGGGGGGEGGRVGGVLMGLSECYDAILSWNWNSDMHSFYIVYMKIDAIDDTVMPCMKMNEVIQKQCIWFWVITECIFMESSLIFFFVLFFGSIQATNVSVVWEFSLNVNISCWLTDCQYR